MTSGSHGCALTQGERSWDRDQQVGYFDSEPAGITGWRMVRNHRANSAFSSPDVVGVGEEDSDFEDVVEGTAASSRIAQQFQAPAAGRHSTGRCSTASKGFAQRTSCSAADGTNRIGFSRGDVVLV